MASGKDTVARFLEDLGFTKLSLSDEIREELRKEENELSRQNEIDKGNSMRKEQGNGILASRVVEKIGDGNHVIVSIRNPGEVEELRKLDGFVLFALNTPDKHRFHFAKEANAMNLKDDYTDSWEEFQALEQQELENEDPSMQQLKQVIGMADHVLENKGSEPELQEVVEALVEKLK